jgi:hypothetical protein
MALRIHAGRPSAASCSDLHLARVLKKFDADSGKSLLESIPTGTSFRIASARSKHSNEVFVKGPKRRTRFECFHAGSKRKYYVPALYEVIVI